MRERLRCVAESGGGNTKITEVIETMDQAVGLRLLFGDFEEFDDDDPWMKLTSSSTLRFAF